MLPLRDSIPARRLSFISISIISLNILIFLYELQIGEQNIKDFLNHWGLIPAQFNWTSKTVSNWLPLFSSQFLHASWFHLLMNMWMLWIFGDNIEDQMGHLFFLFFYLFCGLGAALAQIWFAQDSNLPMVGASGAISGVMGAYLRLFPHSRILTFVPILIFPAVFAISAKFFLLYWLVLQIISGGLSLGFGEQAAGGVAWWAHIGGFVTGFAYASLFMRRRRE